jgi:DNA-binding NtrC family response regulator
MSGIERQERVLCVDPGRQVRRQLQRALADQDLVVVGERDVGRVLEHLEARTYALLVFSSEAVRGKVSESLELLEIISAHCTATQVIFLVHPGDIKLAAPALRAGTYHYSKLPMSDEELKLLVETAIQQTPSYGTNLLLRDMQQPGFEDMVGNSPAMRDLYRLIRQAAATDIPVLLSGETGTGKDLAARAIHQLSSRQGGTYQPVHLGALPENLVASELFGHERGAYTGAGERRPGCFEQATQGTVFLDEISTIDERIQVSLLRLLEDRQLHRIGGNSPVTVDVRVIAATNEDLEQAVRDGRFREDLFYRLEVLQIPLPALRCRHGDIPLLIDFFLHHFNQVYGKSISALAPDCVALLEGYHWPGNVRELKNVIHRAAVLCSGHVLLPEHIPQRLRQTPPQASLVSLPLGSTLAEMERELVVRTLAYARGNRSRAASILGISRRALYNKMDRYNLHPSRPR